MKAKKGFTLIELLAVIIILAIIALIVVPQVLKILYKSRLGAAEDSTYGVVNSAENYTGNLMIKNNGAYPNEDLYFLCNGSCKLQNELAKYNLEGLKELTLSGEKPTGGTVIITNGGQKIIVKDLKINGFTCNYPVDEKANCEQTGEGDGPLVIPTVQMNPSGWSQSKTGIINFSGTGQYLINSNVNVQTNVKATACSVIGNSVYICDGETIPAGGTLSGGNKWYEVTEMPTLTFTSNGTVQYKAVNGSNTTETGTINVHQIDRTAPISATFTTTQTTNSITVTASGVDNESGISGYQFSRDGGSTWTAVQENNRYTFSGLAGGSYNIKVRVINGTYKNIGQNDMNATESDTKTVTTGSLTVPVGNVNQSGWNQSKTVTITYTGDGTYLLRPSVNVQTNMAATTCSNVNNGTFTCNGANIAANGTLQADTWYKVTGNPILTFTSAGSISMKVADGTNYKDGSAVTVSQVDRTAPTAATFTTTSTTNSITLTASGTDAESGISRYQFSSDGGSTWLPSTPQTGNSYTFSSLSSGSYNIKVRVINGTYGNNGQNDMNTKVSDTKSISTGTLTTPTAQVNQSGWSQNKTGTISFSGSGTYLVRPTVNVTTNVAAVTCPTVANATATCNGANIVVNGTMLANTWYKVTSNPTLTFTANGSVSYKVVDGTNYKDGGALTIAQIDRTAPTAATFTTTSTTNSITLTASGTDAESGISRYQFSSDGGSTWLPSTPQTGNSYTFSSLSSGSYNIKVRVINGTYGNNGQNDMNTKVSDTKSISTGSLTVPTAQVSPSGWSQSKTATITYTGNGTYLLRPSVNVTTNMAATTCSNVNNGTFTCNGANVAVNGTLQANTWYKVTGNPILTFTSAGSVSMKVADGTNYKDGSAVTVSQIDRTAPTSSSFTTTQTTNSITVTASGTDAESGILRYQFSRDGGSTWLPSTPQTDTSYTFSGLTGGSYNIKVRVINGTFLNNGQNDMNTKVSDTRSITTGSLTVPTGKVNQSGWTQSKTVTITYTGSGAYLFRPSVNVTTNVAAVTCSSTNNGAYTCNGATVAVNGTLQANTWYKVTSNPTLTFTSTGSISMKVADGINYKDGSAVTVSQIDRTAPTAASFSTTTTTNSITVTASGTDAESGISRYQFSIDGGSTWLPSTPQTGNSYTFSSLSVSSGSSNVVQEASSYYSIKVRVINGTYDNNGQNDMNTTNSDSKFVSLKLLTTPTGKVNETGWTQSKTVTITYTGSGAYLFRPSVNVTTNVAAVTCSSTNNGAYTCNGATVAANGTLTANTWYKVTSNPTLTFTSTGSISMKVADGTNYKDGSAVTVSQIDRTAPTIPTLTATVGPISSYNTTSVAFTATSSDSGGSGMNRYIFYNGSTQLGTVSTSANTASYTTTNLPASAMNFKVTVYDSAGNSSSFPNSYEESVRAMETCAAQPTQVCINGKKATIYICGTSGIYTNGTRQYSVTTGTNC